MLTSVEHEAIDADASVILDADALQSAGHIRKRSEGGDQPAIAKASLLDVVAAGVLEEGRAVKDLVDALDSLGDVGIGIGDGLPGDVPLGGTQAVQAVSLLPLEIPILQSA